MPIYDFHCESGHDFERLLTISNRDEAQPCPICNGPSKRVYIGFPSMPTTIVIDYPGSKKLKAGYVHSHGDKTATKVQSGFGGMVGGGAPKDIHPLAKNVVLDPPRPK